MRRSLHLVASLGLAMTLGCAQGVSQTQEPLQDAVAVPAEEGAETAEAAAEPAPEQLP